MNLLMAAAPTQANANSGWIQMVMIVAIFGIFYLLVFLPQKKQRKQRETMLSSIKKGDKVITVGGLHGEVIELDDEDIRLKVADKVELKFSRSSIAKIKD